MSALGKTIRLFLVDGSPTGLITAEIMNWTGKVLSFPRVLLPEALKRPEVAKTGIYFLVGPDPEHVGKSLIYIGESDDVAKRLKQHDSDPNREFFEQVALIVSKDENLTKSHVRYLESRLIEIVRSARVATLANGTQGSPVQLPEPEQHDMEYVLQQLRVILPVLGFPFLEEPPLPLSVSEKDIVLDHNVSRLIRQSPRFELSYLNGQVTAEAYESEGKFVVMAGATTRHPDEATKPMLEDRYAYIFDDIKSCLENGVLVSEHTLPRGFVRLTQNKAFNSPSRAASFICANPMSGPTYWKVKQTGQSYKEWREAQLNATETPTQTKEETFV